MRLEKLSIALMLLLPGLSWGRVAAVPEPDILPLLAMGGVVALALKFMRRKK